MIGSTCAITTGASPPVAPAALRGGAQRGGVLDGAVEVRLGEDRGARLPPSIACAHASGSVTPSRSGDLDDLHAVAVGVGAQRLQRVRVQAGADDDQRAPPLCSFAR